MAQLEQEEEKNALRDEELYNFKNDELPKLQETYENLIKSVKDDKDKQIIDMNNKMADLAKENVSLKYQIKRKQIKRATRNSKKRRGNKRTRRNKKNRKLN